MRSLAGACSSDDSNQEAATEEVNEEVGPEYDPGRVRFDSGVVPGSHDCVPPDGAGVQIAWDELENPIYEEPFATKNQTRRNVDGRWHMWFSSGTREGMGYVTSSDWTDWVVVDEARSPDSGGSTDITRAADGRYVVARQVEDDRPVPDSRKVVYRTADDVTEFYRDPPDRIAPGIFDNERQIDAAFAHTQWGVYAIFKRGLSTTIDQTPTLVYSPSGDLAGPWELIGDVDSIGLGEQFQVLTIDGKWHLLVTSIPAHDPTLFRMDGDPADSESWLDWTLVGTFEIPEEDWNTGPYETRDFSHDIANTAYLCDARAVDGTST